jgi:hypothetical protein
MHRSPPKPRWACTLVMLLLLPCCVSGCQLFGIVAQALPPPTIQPPYNGLANQTVGVVVWADRGIRADWPQLRLHIANAIQGRLQLVQKNEKKLAQLQGTHFPVEPASILKYIEDNPSTAFQPISETAPKLGVSRLIYVEIETFQTRVDTGVELYRGEVGANLKVVEITNGIGKVAYEESNIRTVFPPKSSTEGSPNRDPYKMYVGTYEALATEIVNRFVPHTEER